MQGFWYHLNTKDQKPHENKYAENINNKGELSAGTEVTKQGRKADQKTAAGWWGSTWLFQLKISRTWQLNYGNSLKPGKIQKLLTSHKMGVKKTHN